MSQNSQSLCPLSDPELGIISETDHKVGRCLCQFCTCNLHLCSFQKTRAYLPIKSKYHLDFERKSIDPKPMRSKQSYVSSPLKMDFKTTNSADYVAFPITSRPSKPGTQSPKQVSMIATSAYNKQFIHYGAVPVTLAKQWHPPVRSTDIHFQGETSYQQNFKPMSVEKVKPAANCKRNNFSFGKDFLETKSSYKRDMKDRSAERANKFSPHREDHRIGSISPSHFKTTANRFFQQGSPIEKDPRQLRLLLLSRKQ